MIDISDWQEFVVSRLFEIKSPATRTIQQYSEGNVPYVSSGAVNNGVLSYLQPINNEQLERGRCITVSPLDGASFYQEKDFLGRGGAGSAISMLYNDNLTEKNALFICTVIKKTALNYDYNDALTGDNLRNLIIKLPVVHDGDHKRIDVDRLYSDDGYIPDWEYMESFMESYLEDSDVSLEIIEKADTARHIIDVKDWGVFNCNTLFECKNTGNILARDVVDGSGTTPFVTASAYNNGVSGYIDASKYEIIKGHCILVGGKTFTITYQKDDFVSNDSHNFVIRVKDSDISELSYLYLVSVIYTYFGQKYSWNDAVTTDKLLNDTIPLPKAQDGNPDWAYMEEYMKTAIDKADNDMTLLQESVLCQE